MRSSSFKLVTIGLCLLQSCNISLCRSLTKPLNKTTSAAVERQDRQKRFTDGIFGINTNPYFGDPTTSGLGSPLERSHVAVPDIDDLRHTGSSIHYSFPGGNSADEYQFPIHGSQYPSFPFPASPYPSHRIPGSPRQLNPFRHSPLGSGVKSKNKDAHCLQICDESNVCQSSCNLEHSDSETGTHIMYNFECNDAINECEIRECSGYDCEEPKIFTTEEFEKLMNAIPACDQADEDEDYDNRKRRDLLEKPGNSHRTKRNVLTAAYLNSKGYCCDRRISKNWEGAKSAGGVIRKIKRRHAGNS